MASVRVPDARAVPHRDGRCPSRSIRGSSLDRSGHAAASPSDRARRRPTRRPALAHWTVAAAPRRSATDRAALVGTSCATTSAPARRRDASTTHGMRAHIGEDGVYLSPDAAWHPIARRHTVAGWTGPDAPLCLWTLDATSPLQLVASGDRGRRRRELDGSGVGRELAARPFRSPRSPSRAARCPPSSASMARC